MLRINRLFAVITACSLLLAPISTPGAQPGLKVVLDGRDLAFDVAPQIVDGRILVPLRAVFEALGATVSYDSGTKTVTAHRNQWTITLRSGSRIGFRNGYIVDLDVPATVQDGRILVPIRFVSEALGASMSWDASTRTVTGTSSEAPPEPGLTELPIVGTSDRLAELLRGLESYHFRRGGFDLAEPERALQEAVKAPADSAAGHSTTNVQVAGVDEADIAKTDGRYIYQVNRGRAVIVDAYPPDGMKLVSSIGFQDAEFFARELYIDDQHLIVIGTSHAMIPMLRPLPEPGLKIYPPPHYSHPLLKALVYDIADRARPRLIRTLELEGNYLSSRKIGSHLYLVANRHLGFRIMTDDMNETPSYRDSADGQDFVTIELDRVRYFPGFVQPNYLVVAGMDISGQDPASVQAFLGAGENLYASTGSMYVAVTGYDGSGYRLSELTHVHRFGLDQGTCVYDGRQAVPGRILNQFSMDEHEGYFRVATTTGQSWRTDEFTSKNNLYILDSELRITGRVEDIAPGEQIYSVRFMGDRAYMVTFRTIDPLFVIDLDPETPRILGALKIPGYSSYLHPYDEHHIIGFGKDTAEIEDKDQFGRVINVRAIDLGMKAALFDVTDVHNPKELHVELIGDRGTDSELLRDHKALLFDRNMELAAFPVTLRESDDQSGWGPMTFQGAYVYRLTITDGFQLRGRITHWTDDDMLKAGLYWGGGEQDVQRVMYIGDVLYTLSQRGIKANDLNTLQEINWFAVP